MIESFHFLRPLWLLAIAPALLLALLLWRARGGDDGWRRAVAPELLTYLLDARLERRQRWPWWLAGAGWVLACVALAGPTWEKLPVPVLQSRDALVVVLDLSLSMTAQDVQPSRLQRARFKLQDVLARRDEGLTGLVAYAGDTHVVTPLTDDRATIENLLPALAPDMMPLYGSRVDEAIARAVELLHNGGVTHGRILLVTDGIETRDIDAIRTQLSTNPGNANHTLAILGVGTEQGAPIPVQGGFLKQRDGNIAIPQLHGERLQQLADATGGVYRLLAIDDSDLDALLPVKAPDDDRLRTTEREFDQWRERGPWLVLALLPFAALAFRRGWLLPVFIALVLLPDSRALADEPAAAAPAENNAWLAQGRQMWRNLWSTRNQQAASALKDGDAETAAQQFTDPAWRASALYRAGRYEDAAQAFQTLRNTDDKSRAEADYNRGNALARAGQLEEAIAAYDAALRKNTALDDARANRALVEKLLQQRQHTGNDDQSSSSQAQQSQQSGQSQSQSQSQEAGSNASPSTSEQTKNDQGKSQAKSSAREEEHDAQPSGEQQAAAPEPDDRHATGEQQPADAQPLTPEQQRQQQATEQWLRQIPDDPSGLLRRKFDYEHRQRRREPTDDNRPLW